MDSTVTDDLGPISLASTLIAVKTHDYCVPPQTLVNKVVAEFERDPTAPGVVVWDGTQVLGVLSRQRCLEHLSQRFGTPLFREAPLQKMLATIVPNYLLFQEDLGINEAASHCLGRPAEVVYEPVVVLPKHGRPRLLSVHDLLAHKIITERHQGTIRMVSEVNRGWKRWMEKVSGTVSASLDVFSGAALGAKRAFQAQPVDHRVATTRPGGPGAVARPGSHRPERAQLTHSVPQVIRSLRLGTRSGLAGDKAKDSAPRTGETSSRGRATPAVAAGAACARGRKWDRFA